jgi:hypothetical protein
MRFLMALVPLSFGAIFTATSARALWRSLWARRWPAAAGRVTETGVFQSTNGGYEPIVRYEYEVAGTRLVGSRLTFGLVALRRSPAAAAKVLGLRPTDAVTVYYDPRRPSDSVLRPAPTFTTFWFLVVGLGMLLIGIPVVIVDAIAK